jgi:hypothetical protein
MVLAMTKKVHDLGWLKRVDQPDGTSALVDAFGKTVATVQTERLAGHSTDLGLCRYRYTVEEAEE